MDFKEINLLEISANPFQMIGKDWMLITAGDESGFNTMTASWGGFGVMWNKNVVTVVVRPQRFTLEFLEKNEFFTLSFFDGENKKALAYCGAHSGRDVDKAKETGLTPCFIDGTTTFEQAKLTFVCKKLYSQQLDAKLFIDEKLLENYPNNDYHIAFTAEIVKSYVK